MYKMKPPLPASPTPRKGGVPGRKGGEGRGGEGGQGGIECASNIYPYAPAKKKKKKETIGVLFDKALFLFRIHDFPWIYRCRHVTAAAGLASEYVCSLCVFFLCVCVCVF